MLTLAISRIIFNYLSSFKSQCLNYVWVESSPIHVSFPILKFWKNKIVHLLSKFNGFSVLVCVFLAYKVFQFFPMLNITFIKDFILSNNKCMHSAFTAWRVPGK